mgnify:CR=1 FL=1
MGNPTFSQESQVNVQLVVDFASLFFSHNCSIDSTPPPLLRGRDWDSDGGKKQEPKIKIKQG